MPLTSYVDTNLRMCRAESRSPTPTNRTLLPASFASRATAEAILWLEGHHGAQNHRIVVFPATSSEVILAPEVVGRSNATVFSGGSRNDAEPYPLSGVGDVATNRPTSTTAAIE